jgi:hypothetical protein
MFKPGSVHLLVMHVCVVSTQFCVCVLQPTSNSPAFTSHDDWHCTCATVEYCWQYGFWLMGPCPDAQQTSPLKPCELQLSWLEHVIGTSWVPVQSLSDETHAYVVVVPNVAQQTCVCALHVVVPQWILLSAGLIGTSTTGTSTTTESCTVTSSGPPSFPGRVSGAVASLIG